MKLAGIDLSEDKLLDKTAIEQVVSALEMNTESTTGKLSRVFVMVRFLEAFGFLPQCE